MAAPQFSSDSSFPIPQKPFTSPTDVDTHRDVFAVYNSFRKLFGKLDGEFAAVYDALSYKLGDAPMDGKQYARKDGNWEEVTGGGGGGGGGALEFMSEVVVTSAVQDIVFDNLDMNSDESYQLELFNVAATTIERASLYYNADLVATNYYFQAIAGNGTAMNAARSNSAEALNLGDISGAPTYATLHIRKVTGKVPVAISTVAYNISSTLNVQTRAHMWTNSANVTKLTLRHYSTFGVGTKARLYRLNKNTVSPISGAAFREVKRDTTQSISTGLDHTLQYDTVVYDPNSEWTPASYGFTVKTAGIYEVAVSVAPGGSFAFDINVSVNNTPRIAAGGFSTWNQRVSGPLLLNAGDVVSSKVDNYSGATRDVTLGHFILVGPL